jgi:hypothetical protein
LPKPGVRCAGQDDDPHSGSRGKLARVKPGELSPVLRDEKKLFYIIIGCRQTPCRSLIIHYSFFIIHYSLRPYSIPLRLLYRILSQKHRAWEIFTKQRVTRPVARCFLDD